MVLRLLEHWRAAREDRSWPAVASFDEWTVPELWPFCYVLDLATDPENPTIARAGRTISSYVGHALAGCRVANLEPDSLPAQPLGFMDEVLQKGVPVSRGGSFRDVRGVSFLYRSIVMPTSEDDQSISALVCAANCRELVSA